MRKNLLLTTFALLLACGGVAAKTIARMDFSLSEANKEWKADCITVSGNTFSVDFGTNDDGGEEFANAAISWLGGNATDISQYTNLVLTLEEATTSEVEIVVSEGGFWGSSVYFTTKLEQGKTEITIPLASMTHNGSNEADGNALDLTKVNMIFLRTGWVHAQTIMVKEFYLEQVEEDELVTTGDTKEIAIGSPTQGEFTLDGATDYKYLVIVPAKPYIEGTQEFVYHIGDGENEVGDWGFAYGAYQPRRAAVLNMTDKKVYNYNDTEAPDDNAFNTALAASSIDLAKLTKLYVTHGWSSDMVNELELSAIYLTNERPNYDNRWNGADYYDYLRDAAAPDTWGTICLPYNAAICGAYAYEVAGVDDLANPTKLYASRVSGLLKAGKSYLFKTNSTKNNDDNYINGGGVFFYKAGASTVAEPEDGALTGTFADNTEVPTGGYILSGGEMRKCVEGATCYVDANRAYLDLSKASVVSSGEASAAKWASFSLCDGSVTAIKGIDTTVQANGAIYTLGGVRVASPAKGVYVRNGKKFVVK